ncbi:transglutaminase family protein [Thiomonas sp. FB-6]|uniref:transglutaminase family protein n=1 Tax=Thiomonas sp. FB-6 TaxID=1158291 RepID=UPI00037D15CE|nr:transglutaminase family protein [Thiomonas sp. FB-6]
MSSADSTGSDASVLYRVQHETRYDYESAVELAHHLAQLRPLSLEGVQHCEAYQCDIEPRPEHLARDLDAYGNERLFFAYYAPHDTLTVRAVSLVRVQAPAQPDWTASPAWEQVRGRLRYHAGRPSEPAEEFSFGSDFSPVFDAAAAFAAPSFPPGRPLLDAAHDLMRRIHAEFTYDPDSTEAHTRAPQALELRHGVCQDYAHVMLSALRSLGLAARYVSGYLRSRPRPGEQALVGADASHAWVSVWCPANGWVEFDPTNDRRPAADYVRVAVGRDFADVSPLRGVIRGGGRHALHVAVNVSPESR